VTPDELADAAAASIVAYKAAEAEAAELLDRARALKDDAVWSLVQAGWSYRKVADELDMSPARVGQLVQRARRAGWGAARATRVDTQRQALADYRAARHAQELREEAFTGGRATERRAFYGQRSAPRVAEAERPLTWHDWIRQSRQEQHA
jgi:transposase